MSGLCEFNRMPTASSSISSSLRCSVRLVASSIMMMRSAVLATESESVSKGVLEKARRSVALTGNDLSTTSTTWGRRVRAELSAVSGELTRTRFRDRRTRSSTLDDTGQIEQLDLRALVLDDSWDSLARRERRQCR